MVGKLIWYYLKGDWVDEYDKKDNTGLVKSIVTILQGLILAALGWIGFNITQTRVDISVLQQRITQQEILIANINNSLDDKYLRKSEADRVFEDLKDRIRGK